MAIRKAIVAGQFYAASFNELKKQLTQCFEGKLGPAALPISKRSGRLFGAIVPHAGYQFSGQAAAWAYKELGEALMPDLFIIAGTNHSGSASYAFSFSLNDFSSPFGTVKTDTDFAKELIEKSKKQDISAGQDEELHRYEHSIEVQLPFLQLVAGKNKKMQIVPLIVSLCSPESCEKLAKAIAETATRLRKNVCIIASSDFTHYGPAYGFMPFTEQIKKRLSKLDKQAIDLILKFNTAAFLNYAQKTTICGAAAIALTIETCKALGAKKEKAELLRYYTSGDITQDWSSAVGYASIVFR